MPGVRRLPSGKLQGWYRDSSGCRRYVTHNDPRATRAAVRAMAARLEDEHQQVRLGYRPARTAADKHRPRPYAQLVQEYLDWGRAQGGRGGRAWAEKHAQNRGTALQWWQQRLGLQTLGDLDGILPRAEEALREVLALRAGKTAANRVEALRALCLWARQRGYLTASPLGGMAPIDKTPKAERRALTLEEVQGLLAVSPPDRCLLYETALLSGLRANELRSLRVEDLDVERVGLNLHA
jgi:integrase